MGYISSNDLAASSSDYIALGMQVQERSILFDTYNHILCIYTASLIIGYKLLLYPFCCDLVLIWNIWALIIGFYSTV